MISFTASIHRFDDQGEKTGWYYIEIAADQAEALFPGNKKIFRVSGSLDQYPLKQVALMPMGDGTFILPVNQAMRKGTGKSRGAMLQVQLEKDDRPVSLAPELLACLEDDEAAKAFFNGLTPGHQRYFSNWVASAKTLATKTKRLAICLDGLSRGMDYGSMIRAQKGKA